MQSIKINFTRNLLRMQRDMSNMLDQFFAHRKRTAATGGLWYPSLDTYETTDALLIVVELAGVDKDDINITVQGNIMKIHGQRKEFPCSGKVRLHQMEIDFGPFERTLEIGVPFRAEEIAAAYKDGFLTITIPKHDGSSGTIEISSS